MVVARAKGGVGIADGATRTSDQAEEEAVLAEVPVQAHSMVEEEEVEEVVAEAEARRCVITL